jgi:CheY-like chemotaxis protein
MTQSAHAASASQPTHAGAQTREMPVLVVDDVHATRAGLAELLRLRSFVVHEAANGRDALQALRAHPEIFVVVLDLQMPQTDGYWFREQQLADPAIAHVPVIVFTGSVDVEPLSRLRLSHVLMKPFSVDDLLNAIAHYCDTSPAAS